MPLPHVAGNMVAISPSVQLLHWIIITSVFAEYCGLAVKMTCDYLDSHTENTGLEANWAFVPHVVILHSEERGRMGGHSDLDLSQNSS